MLEYKLFETLVPLRDSQQLRQTPPSVRSSSPTASAKRSARFYDFNVWSRKKKIEKLAEMHMNPVKRGPVARPDHWIWSSCKFYGGHKETLIRIDPVE